MVNVQDQAASLEPAPCSPCCMAAGCSPEKERNKKQKVRKHQLFISASRFNIQEAIFGSKRDVCQHFRDINTIQKK